MNGRTKRSFPPASAPCAYVCFCARARRTESARAAALYTHLYPRALRRVPSMRPGPGFVPAQRPRACFRALAPALAQLAEKYQSTAACFFTPCPRPGPVRPRFPPARLHAPAPPRARDAVPAAPRAGI